MHCSAKYSIAILYIWHSLKIDWVYRFHMSLNTPNISHSTFFQDLGVEQIVVSLCLICMKIAVFPSFEQCFSKHEVGLCKQSKTCMCIHPNTQANRKKRSLALCSTGFQECWYKYPLVSTFLLVHFIPKILALANHQARSFIFLTVCMDKLGFFVGKDSRDSMKTKMLICWVHSGVGLLWQQSETLPWSCHTLLLVGLSAVQACCWYVNACIWLTPVPLQRLPSTNSLGYLSACDVQSIPSGLTHTCFSFSIAHLCNYLCCSSIKYWCTPTLSLRVFCPAPVFVLKKEKDPLLVAIMSQNEVELPNQCFRVDKINYPTSLNYYLSHAQSHISPLKCKVHDQSSLTSRFVEIETEIPEKSSLNCSPYIRTFMN